MVMKLSARATVLSLCLGLVLFAGQPATADGGGKKDAVADKVNKIVAKAIGDNPGVGPALIRLLFHDCWVNGCDGSVLLDSSLPYGSKPEKEAKNNIGLDGFTVIDEIKDNVGEEVSCADIVVLAARDATFIVSRGMIDYAVKMGRMDGVVSSAAAADAVLPPSTFNITQLEANFAAKGLNTRELVALSGAHAVGVAHRSSFQDRIDNATATPIVPKYRKALTDDVQKQKKLQGTQDPIEPNNIRDKEFAFRNASGYDDTGVDTSDAAKGVLDNSYYHANLQNKVLFRSDWELRNDTTGAAGQVMATFEADAKKWFLQFGNAMAKLSKLPAEGTRFEIRKNCRKTN